MFTFRKGKIARYEEFYEEQEALEAAGLPCFARKAEAVPVFTRTQKSPPGFPGTRARARDTG